MNCLSFFGYAIWSQQSFNEKIANSFNSFWKFSSGYLKLIVSLVFTCIGIIRSTVERYELWILIVFRILFWSHKKHVFQEVSDSQWSFTIHQTANTYWDGTCSFLCFSIMNQQYLEFVWQLDCLILALVVGGFSRNDSLEFHCCRKI